jgi:hypothetical protein
MKIQDPGSKIQKSSKSQAPNGGLSNVTQPYANAIDVWILVFVWSLELGAWSFCS